MASVTSPAAEAPAKRASSRVRKQPDVYAASVYSSGKRKRADEDDIDVDGDVDMADENASDEDDDDEGVEDDDPAEEELRERGKKSRQPKSSTSKKPAPKKAKVNGMSLPFRSAAKAPVKRRAPKKAKALDSADAEAAGGLYADVFASDKQIEEVVADWLQAFKQHESNALANLINFVLKAAGCNGKVTDHDIEEPDGATARLEDLQAEHQATEPTDYPLIAKGKHANAFKSTVVNFILHLTKSIGAADLLNTNPELIENIGVWLSPMSSGTNRSFRHTSTLCCLVIVTGLCDFAKDLAVKSADDQRHAEMERKKARPNKERVKQIEKKAKDASAELEYVQALLKDWFDSIFIHRYRDVDAHIRRECVEALGDWIATLPDQFFDGHHLRYVGWLLSDDTAFVRAENMRQLIRLYSDSSKLGGLKTFTERFRPRIVEIGTSDADISVRVAGIELLNLLRQNDLLEPDDIDAIGRLVFHEDIKIRKAVADFFCASVEEVFETKINELGGAEALEETLPEPSETNFEAPRIEWLRFKSLAEMLHAYDQEDAVPSQFERNRADGTLILHAAGLESRFTLAVDVLYQTLDDLKEWQALAGYLLYDHSTRRSRKSANDPLSQLKQESILNEDEELILLEVLNASVKHSLSELTERITSTKVKLTKRQKEDLQEEQEESVRNLTDLIPKLLKKFGDLPSTAGAVLRLGNVLALPALRGLRQDSTASAALLDDLHKQFMSHGTDEVLAPATAAILHAQSYDELDETALEKLTSLWEDVVSNLAELLNVATFTVRGTSQQEELLALSNNLLRIVRLSTVSNCIPHLEEKNVAANDVGTGREANGTIDFINDLIQRGVPSSGPAPDPEEAVLEDLVASRAAEAALFYFRWKLSSIMTAIKTGANADVAYEVLEALAERRDTYVNNLVKVLDSRRAGEQISISAAGCLLDLYTSAAILRTEKVPPGMSEDYTVLIMDLNQEHETAVMKVFQAAERDYARLSGKRLDEPVLDEDADLDVDADPIDDDPLSDDDLEEAQEAELDGQTQTQTQASQQQQHLRDAKLLKPVMAEERLCQLTTKLLYAILAGVIDDKATRKRLERNKSKLGANYKEVLAYLDVSGKQKQAAASRSKAKPKSKFAATATATAAAAATAAAPAGRKPKANPKSNAIVAEDEEDDEIEDTEEEEEEEEARQRELEAAEPLEEEEEEEQGHRRDDDEEEEEMTNGVNAAAVEADMDVLGD